MAKKLSLVSALAWIVGSTLVISGSAYNGMRHYLRSKHQKQVERVTHIFAIVQTGPQKEALKTVYLAELMGLTVDCPCTFAAFDPEEVGKKLRASPVIKEAHVKTMKPGTVYVDYTVRQPVAWLYDYTNTALDDEGCIFPVSPFFPPKNLPEVYLGLTPFTEEMWHTPLQGREVKLALDLLKLFAEPAYRDLFHVQRIDVSKAYAESYGSREIVLSVEDEIFSGETRFILPRLLRLSTKNYAQELGNYLKLREELLAQERKDPTPNPVQKTINLRLPNLGYIDQR